MKKKKFEEFLKTFHDSGNIIKVLKHKKDTIKARSISVSNYGDVIHAILANKAGAEYLLTRNIKDFAGCEYLLKIKLPENL